MEITTGVMNPNVSASEWFWEEYSIDPNWEDYRKEQIDLLKTKYLKASEEQGWENYDEEDAIADAKEHFDNECHDDYEESDVLYGKWNIVTGQYEPDETGDYAAIYRGGSYGSYVLQVVWSKFAIWCKVCSPCYPGGQGDIESEGEEVLSYILPPDLLDEKWYEENKHRIRHVEDLEQE